MRRDESDSEGEESDDVGEKEDTMRRGKPILQACLEFDDIHIGFVCIIFIIRSMKNKMHHKSNSVERMIR